MGIILELSPQGRTSLRSYIECNFYERPSEDALQYHVDKYDQAVIGEPSDNAPTFAILPVFARGYVKPWKPTIGDLVLVESIPCHSYTCAQGTGNS